MNEVKMILPVKPIPKARPRIGSWGVYTPKRTADAEMVLAWCVRQQWPKMPPVSGPIELEAVFYIEPPKKQPKKGIEQEQPCLKRPDIDNYLKLVMDALNGLVWLDDSQVWKLTAKKIYFQKSQIELIIRWLQ